MSLLVPLGWIFDVDVRSHENNSAHRTREIDLERLIVRRGQPFSITLQCSETLPPRHHLELVLHLGEYYMTDWETGKVSILFHPTAHTTKQRGVRVRGRFRVRTGRKYPYRILHYQQAL